MCGALSPRTLLVVGATHPESLRAAAEKEPPLVAGRESRNFLLLGRRHPAPGPAQPCHHCFSHPPPSLTLTEQGELLQSKESAGKIMTRETPHPS